jgi:hypothetical protein
MLLGCVAHGVWIAGIAGDETLPWASKKLRLREVEALRGASTPPWNTSQVHVPYVFE